MNEQIETGGPAFPCEQSETQEGAWNQTFAPGMSLRDYFAAKAIQVAWRAFGSDYVHQDSIAEAVAECAYKIADAMLKARTE